MLFSNLKIDKGRVITKDQEPGGEMIYQGLPIFIENEAGSERKLQNGNVITMLYDYGYIQNTIGADNEELDCFVNRSNPYAPDVFIIRQQKDDGKKFDEEKVFLGFLSEASCRDAFLAHCNSQDIFGGITKLPMFIFKETLEFR